MVVPIHMSNKHPRHINSRGRVAQEKANTPGPVIVVVLHEDNTFTRSLLALSFGDGERHSLDGGSVKHLGRQFWAIAQPMCMLTELRLTLAQNIPPIQQPRQTLFGDATTDFSLQKPPP